MGRTIPRALLPMVLLWTAFISEVISLLPPPLTGLESPTGKGVRSKPLPSFYANLKVTEEDLEEAVDFAQTIIDHMRTREANLIASEIGIKNGTPSHGSFIAYGPEEEAIRRGKIGHLALTASTRLVTRVCGSLMYDLRECAIFVNKFSFKNTALRDFCRVLDRRCSREETYYMYRSADGTCNNDLLGSLGESFTGYERLLEPHYITLSYIRRAQNKKPLPPPRAVSLALVTFKENPHESYTTAVAQWAEFVEHDLSRSAVSVMVHSAHNIDCCDSNGRWLSPRYVHPFCAPIHPPDDDTYYNSIHLDCMSYVRSIPAVRAGCTFGTPDQMNQVTHYLDVSQLYGSTFARTSALREHTGGRLNASSHEGRSFLQKSSNPTQDCQVASSESKCFSSGDRRVNMQPSTAAMYTIWMREHNRLANELAKMNPAWDDEIVFQETRRIVIAEIQHITYKEWLPLVLGPNYIRKMNMNSKYNPKTDSSVSNSFATAAIRAVTSLYASTINLYDESREKIWQTLQLSQYFNNPELILEKGKLDGIIRGLATQITEQVDMHFSEEVINKLYSNGRIGYDVLSLDIERSRDHGLPGYSQFRALCGLPYPDDISDLVDVMSPENVQALGRIYSHHADIDLIVGGLMETPEPESLFGPTFSCIIADQFLRTREGDRYFYTNARQPKPFTDDQLREIKKVTLSRILCDNSDGVQTMQRTSFVTTSDVNPLVSCGTEEIPKISLIPWLDSRERYSLK